MRSGLTKSFIADVRQMYEETEPPITVEEELPAPIAVEKPTDCLLIPTAHVPLKKRKKMRMMTPTLWVQLREL